MDAQAFCLRESTVERDDWARCPRCNEPQFTCHIDCPELKRVPNPSGVLRGNFTPASQVEPVVETETLEDRFERAAMKRLGGSIAFVSKKKVQWDSKPG